MLGFGPISENAVSAIPDWVSSIEIVTFTDFDSLGAVLSSPYITMVTSTSVRMVYGLELYTWPVTDRA